MCIDVTGGDEFQRYVTIQINRNVLISLILFFGKLLMLVFKNFPKKFPDRVFHTFRVY